MTTQPAAGWYPDPNGSGRQRYFDGATWTENYAPPAAQSPVVKTSNSGRTLAIIFGVIGIALVLIVGVSCVAALSRHDSRGNSGASGPGILNDQTGAINQPVSDGKFTFTVTGMDQMDSIGLTKPRGRFVIIDVTVKNTSREAKSFQVNDQILVGSNNAKYKADWVAAGSINEENTLLLQLGPGFDAKYRLPFDVPSDVSPLKVELHDSSLSRGATIKLS
ncbi:DUF4352 domain-containing protein [Mycobacterium sp. Z3061]|uniref:DUF4352 domain-containing protein n=1 Tax=Mycobacterium sp. Z3061 TaxID=3073562 RepID=UPI0028737FAC|nr:DUF4352 domain-containing protein [Mycobacterium sp. Z3061]